MFSCCQVWFKKRNFWGCPTARFLISAGTIKKKGAPPLQRTKKGHPRFSVAKCEIKAPKRGRPPASCVCNACVGSARAYLPRVWALRHASLLCTHAHMSGSNRLISHMSSYRQTRNSPVQKALHSIDLSTVSTSCATHRR